MCVLLWLKSLEAEIGEISVFLNFPQQTDENEAMKILF